MGNAESHSLSAEEKARRQQLERMGVLIPPSFGVGNDALPPSAVAVRGPTPSYLKALERDLLCCRILNEHMSSGLWVSAATPAQASVLALFAVTEVGSAAAGTGMLSASQKFSQGHADIRAYTTGSAFTHAKYSPLPGAGVHGVVNASGGGWIGGQVSPLSWWRRRKAKQTQTYYRNNPFIEEEEKAMASNTVQALDLGSSLQFQSPSNVPDLLYITVTEVTAYVSMDVISKCTIAVEATVPIKSLEPQFAYHVSCDLNSEDGPPLVISMQSSPARSSISLSQVLTFDRHVLNAFETRCPKIRNTLAWAVQMEKEKRGEAQLMAGLAWQINRAVAVKMLANPSNGGITAGLLLKRWRQPRVLCSLLVGIGQGQKPKLGLGLELETGPQQSQDYYNDKQGGFGHVEEGAPETRPTLPNNVQNVI